MKLYRLFSMLLAVLVMASCGGNAQQATGEAGANDSTQQAATAGGVKYLPYQEVKDGPWGLVALTGEVLVKPQYKYAPTVPIEDLFWTIDDDGQWTLHRAQADAPQVGTDKYQHATAFCGGRAVVQVKGKAPCIIDTEGKVVKDLATIDGAQVKEVHALQDGVAVFVASNDHMGVIDSEGKVLVPARYCQLTDCEHGIMLGVDAKYSEGFSEENYGDFNEYETEVLDKTGKVTTRIDHRTYSLVTVLGPGLLAVSKPAEGDTDWNGVLDTNGKVVMEPNSSITDFTVAQGDLVCVKAVHNDKHGLANLKDGGLVNGDTQWNSLDFAGPEGLMVAGVTNEGSLNYTFSYVKTDGTPASTETWCDATSFKMWDGKHALVRSKEEGPYGIIDTAFKPVAGLPTIMGISTYVGESKCHAEPYHEMNWLYSLATVMGDAPDVFELGAPPVEQER